MTISTLHGGDPVLSHVRFCRPFNVRWCVGCFYSTESDTCVEKEIGRRWDKKKMSFELAIKEFDV